MNATRPLFRDGPWYPPIEYQMPWALLQGGDRSRQARRDPDGIALDETSGAPAPLSIRKVRDIGARDLRRWQASHGVVCWPCAMFKTEPIGRKDRVLFRDFSKWIFNVEVLGPLVSCVFKIARRLCNGGDFPQRNLRNRASRATISPERTALTSGDCAAVWISCRVAAGLAMNSRMHSPRVAATIKYGPVPLVRRTTAIC
jgi:hypothetical protein